MIMTLWFSCWLAAVIAQRCFELRLAKANAKKIRSAGGYEVGAEHYPQIVSLHIAFFVFLLAEFFIRSPEPKVSMAVAAVVFLVLQAARVWCILSLGMYWNTRIYVVKNMQLIRKGPYRYVRHPNYMVVTLEMLVFPLMFGCPLTSLIFPMLNITLLRKRIAIEELALSSATAQPDMDMATGGNTR